MFLHTAVNYINLTIDYIPTHFLFGGVVIFIKLEVISSSHKEVLFRMQWGRVNGSRGVHGLNQIQTEGERQQLTDIF